MVVRQHNKGELGNEGLSWVNLSTGKTPFHDAGVSELPLPSPQLSAVTAVTQASFEVDMSQGSSNHVASFTSHISGSKHPAPPLVFFTSAVPRLGPILKGKLPTRTHVRMHTRTKPTPLLFMFCLHFCPRSWRVTALSARRIKTNPVKLVIRDKSCRHYMTKSLKGKWSHAVYVGLCVSVLPKRWEPVC